MKTLYQNGIMREEFDFIFQVLLLAWASPRPINAGDLSHVLEGLHPNSGEWSDILPESNCVANNIQCGRIGLGYCTVQG